MKKQFLTAIALILVSTIAWAQPPVPPATPIDGGLGLLLAGGFAYGVSRIKKLRK